MQQKHILWADFVKEEEAYNAVSVREKQPVDIHRILYERHASEGQCYVNPVFDDSSKVGVLIW
jgi:hypothetical protein